DSGSPLPCAVSRRCPYPDRHWSRSFQHHSSGSPYPGAARMRGITTSMKIYILTDQEGVAGVVNSVDYANPSGRYHEVGRRLLTLETNAAIEGAFAGGATEIFVLDGHGHGSIDIELLDPRVEVLAGRPITFPFEYD